MKLDNKKLSLHMHLFYKDPAIYLLEKISEFYSGKIYISLNDTGKDNDQILESANKLYPEVVVTKVKNRGNDQFGFYNSFKQNQDNTDWIFYCHDKTIKRIDWLDEILDPLLFQKQKSIDELLANRQNGVISSDGIYKHEMLTEEKLTELSKSRNFDSRLKIIQARHTLTWYRELQYILLTETGFIDTENLNPDFTAGNMFMARREIVKMCHSCVHESYFENYYREDGNVEHALERFYYYVSLCLKYKNVFVNKEQLND